ncbi:MAG TPA: phosphatidylglycerol lysyltransferase domain-containing protein [Candidatus Saccharimonadales bacterium]|nr:phosphatidylglycerol lysyltransferase domain-containing protein [Candidatus Saccharimonadales bacterium]
MTHSWWRRQLQLHQQAIPNLVAWLVGLHGAFIVATTLVTDLGVHLRPHLSNLVIDIPLLLGLSLLYLSAVLKRRKSTAWVTTLVVYGFLLGLNAAQLLDRDHRQIHVLTVARLIILPAVMLTLLIAARRLYVVRSDAQGFRIAVRLSCTLLVVAFVYGTAGFSLLDTSDFHQAIRVPTAMHYTIDQFDLTTNHPVRPYTKRARLFVDSLSVISIGAAGYTVLALFQPLRQRLHDQQRERERLTELMTTHRAPSEDFFKLWPTDKQYFFDQQGRAGLAFQVHRRMALCLGDPIGSTTDLNRLLTEFDSLCYGNDWQPAFIHVDDRYRALYERHGYELQHLGQEAIVSIDHFQEHVVTAKYFRHIMNKFSKAGFQTELLSPPHHPAVMERLRVISQDWLAEGHRVERGFVMGYFSTDYLQQCQIMVARDAAGTIQAFLNQVPAEFDHAEATYDLLRHTTASPGNINDYLLASFIARLADQQYTRLNMGLCPLVGLDSSDDAERSLLDNVLGFAYANGDRFYSFSGLERFKAKYEPEWSDRYLAYRGGLPGFSRTMNALLRVMRKNLKMD